MKINKFKKAWANIQNKSNSKTKKTYAEKAEETRMFTQRLCDMQHYVDISPEKRAALLETINTKSTTSKNETLLEKGVIIYVELLDVIDVIRADFEKLGIDYKFVTSKVNTKGRKEVCEWFKKDPHNKAVIISSCGGESLNLNFTDEMVLYNVPKGSGKFSQLIGRIDRLFGEFNAFNIHYIIVEDTIDEYKQILLSSKKQLEMEILTQDTIPIKRVDSFDQQVLKKIRQYFLWKNGAGNKPGKTKGV